MKWIRYYKSCPKCHLKAHQMEKRIFLVLKAAVSVRELISVGEKTPIMLKRTGSLRQVRHVRPNMRIELDTQVILDVSDPFMCC